MKLDRNINSNGRGKYALLKLRRLNEIDPKLDLDVDRAIRTLEEAGILDWGNTPETEFFVMRLKDKYSRAALYAYSDGVRCDGEKEFASEVDKLASRAGDRNPHCKRPD